jgi:cytochrome c oxidase subunit 4
MNGTATKLYLRTTAALLGLLALTVVLAFFDLGSFNTIAATGISTAKAGLVIFIFMDVRSGRLIPVAAGAGFFWLAVLFALSMSDYLTR